MLPLSKLMLDTLRADVRAGMQIPASTVESLLEMYDHNVGPSDCDSNAVRSKALRQSHAALLASCRELRDAMALAIKYMDSATWDRFNAMRLVAGITDGVGTRADAAIATATRL